MIQERPNWVDRYEVGYYVGEVVVGRSTLRQPMTADTAMDLLRLE